MKKRAIQMLVYVTGVSSPHNCGLLTRKTIIWSRGTAAFIVFLLQLKRKFYEINFSQQNNLYCLTDQ